LHKGFIALEIRENLRQTREGGRERERERERERGKEEQAELTSGHWSINAASLNSVRL